MFHLTLTIVIFVKFVISGLLVSTTGTKSQKVCVIGAGAAGLSVARHLVEYQNEFNLTVFERSSDVGGLWKYTDKTEIDDDGYPVHSSAYKSLHINILKEQMGFPDYPILGNNESSVSHEVILEYLKNYTNHFKLRSLIKFNSIVLNVDLMNARSNLSEKWIVTVKNTTSGEFKVEVFDKIIICNGHNFSPRIPKISRMGSFKGSRLHSHSYREPEPFKNKTIMVVGAGPSGQDISKELSSYGCKVYFSRKDYNESEVRKPRLYNVPRILRVARNGSFLFVQGNYSFVEPVFVDVIIFCTGYDYSYPFLNRSTGIKVDDNYISPLYQHMINVDHPTMSFIGIPERTYPFFTFDVQAYYIVELFRNKVVLPEKSEMVKNSLLKTFRKKDAHVLDDFLIYALNLAALGNFTKIFDAGT